MSDVPYSVKAIDRLVQEGQREDWATCSKCGWPIKPGDWPWCQGNPEDHKAPKYSWQWGDKR